MIEGVIGPEFGSIAFTMYSIADAEEREIDLVRPAMGDFVIGLCVFASLFELHRLKRA